MMTDLAIRAGRTVDCGVSKNLAALDHLIADNGLTISARPELALLGTTERNGKWWRAFSLGERSMALAITLTGLSMAVAVIWSATVGLTVELDHLTTIASAVVIAVVATISSAFATRYFEARKTGAAKWAKRIALRVQLTAVAGLLLLLLGIAVTVLAHLAFGVSDGSDLRDAQFVALDRRLGFDWTGYIDRLNKNAAFGNLLITAHHVAPALIAAPVLLLGITNQRRRLAEFVCGLALAMLAVLLMMVWLPTTGAYVHLAPNAGLFANLNPDAGRTLTDLIDAWHGSATMIGTGRQIDPLNFGVMLSLPGLQVSLAVLVVYALRRMLLTGVAAACLCLLISLSPLNEAGHYLSQSLIGGMIAVGCILFTQVLRIKRRLRPAPIRLRVEREGDFLTWEKPAR